MVAKAMSLARTAQRLALREGRQLGRRARRGLGAWYYRFLFDRPWPLAEAAGAVVLGWEQRDRRGDVPQDQATWERQYAEGRWAFMAEPRELVRYSAVADLLAIHAPAGAVLDVGCGEGLLLRRLRERPYSSYLGLDIAATAVARLAAEEDERTRVVCADADSYTPAGQFDAIIFNESLYYLRRPFVALARFAGALAPGGVLIVSTYTASPRAMAIRRGLERRLALLQSVTADRGDLAYLCEVFAPRAPQEGR